MTQSKIANRLMRLAKSSTYVEYWEKAILQQTQLSDFQISASDPLSRAFETYESSWLKHYQHNFFDRS